MCVVIWGREAIRPVLGEDLGSKDSWGMRTQRKWEIRAKAGWEKRAYLEWGCELFLFKYPRTGLAEQAGSLRFSRGCHLTDCWVLIGDNFAAWANY